MKRPTDKVISLRVPESLYPTLIDATQREFSSINAWVLRAIVKAAADQARRTPAALSQAQNPVPSA